MIKLIKHLKKYSWSILLIFVLLIVQAQADLALPGYTSDIVNVGIQQSGIESSVPKVIRQSEIDKIALLTGEDEAVLEEIKSAYDIVNDGEETGSSLVKSNQTGEALYIFKGDKAQRERLEKLLSQPLAIIYILDSNGEESQMLQQQIAEGLPVEMVEQLTKEDGSLDLWLLFSQMPKESVAQMVEMFNQQLSQLPEAMMTQSGIAYVKSEYQALDINLETLQRNYILVTGAKMLGLALVAAIMIILVSYTAAKIAAKLCTSLRSQVFHKVMSFSDQEMDKFSTASLITRSTNDIQQIQTLIVMLLRMLLYSPILAFGAVVKVLNTNSKMSWLLAISIGAIILVIAVLFLTIMPKFKLLQKLVDRLNLVTREVLTGLPVIRAFSREKHEQKRFEKANRDLMKTNLLVNRVMSAMMPIMMLIMNFTTLAVVWVGADYVDMGTMQVGDMMAFISYAMMIIMSFLMLTMVSIVLPRATVAMGRVDEILETEVMIKEVPQTEAFDENQKGVVVFDHVSFKYPDAEDYVLEDIDFVAKPGEVTAIIGSTGSGKSTVVNLIPRFFDVTEGQIRVDGKDIRQVDLKDLRDRIGYVPQKGVLFSGTIESNIKYGDTEISDEQMKRAAMIAQAEDFIEGKDEQYESPISQGGTNVSGGQKQRLSIARAIAKNPEVYIFDDSFSALDYKTDQQLRKALKEEIKDSTMIIVAQRLSTILEADQILVLDEGRVVNKGTHQELIKNCEVYQQIAKSQLSEAELEKYAADVNERLVSKHE